MKQAVFFLILSFAGLRNGLAAQTLPAPADTFRQERMRIYYGPERIKDQGRMDKILLSIDDPRVNANLQTAKSLEPLYWIMALGGAVMMGVGGYNSLNGKLNNGGLYIGGGALMLGSGVVSMIGGNHRKKAMRRFNEVRRGNQPVAPPIPTVMLPADSDAVDVPHPAAARPPEAQKSQMPYAKRALERRDADSPATLGFTAGIGWSKQHISYEYAFDNYLSARVFSFGLQYGKPISEHWSWQLELGLTQHGFRNKETMYNSGVKVVANADARLRYLEIPFSLLYRRAMGKKGFTLAAAPGFSMGYAVNAKVVARASGHSDTRNVKVRVADKIPLHDASFGDRLDIAFHLGARAEYPVRPGKVFIEMRYHLGVLNLDRNSGDSSDKTFNRSWLCRLGYLHAIK